MEARPSIGQGKDRWVACSILDQQLFATRYESTGLSFEGTLASPLSFAYQNSPESSRLDDTGVFCWFVDPKNSGSPIVAALRRANR
ncbi:hypothetical protein D8B26_002494 [Coccidioides posadasii str. Silveira]|uniref:uncharacterized protein n=1 Tax=Coccidioides posadasii (strain RMSCC 757 / Silveira) TaxID=443226 RepID=UPI001BF01498|nr:hypothetical protein D8B26_002494 [Coccidioides posadasii str. Silveira]